MEAQLVPAGPKRLAVTGVALPDPPPTRIYISGREYRIVAPSVALPPLINTAKLILNWVGPASRVAKNILYVLTAGGTGTTSDGVWLKSLANQTMTSLMSSNVQGTVGSNWSLNSVTAKDNGGTAAQATSDHAAIPGVATGATFPPSVAITISWIIPESYRGGKPRTYMPGVPESSSVTAGDSAIAASFATLLESHAVAFLTSMNAALLSGTSIAVGTVSHYHGHSLRPTPVFYTYLGAKVHERLDSQRRRSGKESGFGVVP